MSEWCIFKIFLNWSPMLTISISSLVFSPFFHPSNYCSNFWLTDFWRLKMPFDIFLCSSLWYFDISMIDFSFFFFYSFFLLKKLRRKNVKLTSERCHKDKSLLTRCYCSCCKTHCKKFPRKAYTQQWKKKLLDGVRLIMWE